MSLQYHFVVYGEMDDHGKITWTVVSDTDAYLPDGGIYDTATEKWEQTYFENPDIVLKDHALYVDLVERLSTKPEHESHII